MVQRFSDEARNALSLAEQEAEKAGKMVISTEHLLLAIVDTSSGNGSKVLDQLGVTREAILTEISKLEPDPVGKKPRAKMILSRDAKQAMDATNQEAMRVNEHLVGTEHLLLGLIAQGGAASKILRSLGVNFDMAREAVSSISSSTANAAQ